MNTSLCVQVPISNTRDLDTPDIHNRVHVTKLFAHKIIHLNPQETKQIPLLMHIMSNKWIKKTKQIFTLYSSQEGKKKEAAKSVPEIDNDEYEFLSLIPSTTGKTRGQVLGKAYVDRQAIAARTSQPARLRMHCSAGGTPGRRSPHDRHPCLSLIGDAVGRKLTLSHDLHLPTNFRSMRM